MRIKLTQPGYENFGDWLGPIAFLNGVSREVTKMEGDRIASIYQCEFIDSEDFKPSERFIAKNMLNADQAMAKQSSEAGATPVDAPVAQSFKLYTEDDLAAIADKDGIDGIREIATPRGVKGTSIRGLITKILKEQVGG